MRRTGIRVTYMTFDLLTLDAQDLTGAPYVERRAQLKALDLNGVYWQTPQTFEDGTAAVQRLVAAASSCTSTEPSALKTRRRTASGRCASRRPV